MPIGGGLWIPIFHPEFRVAPPYNRMGLPRRLRPHAEFAAPVLGNRNNRVTIDAEIPADANGVLYKLGAHSARPDALRGGRHPVLRVQPVHHRANQDPRQEKLPTGKVKIEVETAYVEQKPAGPLKVTLKVNGKVVAEGTVPVSAPVCFTANDCLDIGQALGSPVSLDYRDRAPFKFNGTIEQVHVKYI